LKPFEVLSIIAAVRSHGTGLFSLAISVMGHFSLATFRSRHFCT